MESVHSVSNGVQDAISKPDMVAAPRYTPAEAARYLRLPPSTLRWWLKGRDSEGHRPVLETADRNLISFTELCELAVIKELRQVRGVTLSSIRKALSYAEGRGITNVLLSRNLRVFQDYLLLANEAETLAISAGGQLALKELIERFSHRISYSSDLGLPEQLHPSFHAEQNVNDRPPISISPLISWGQPVLTGTGIKTAVIAAFAAAGNDPAFLAREYDVDPALIKNAVLYEYAV